MMESGVTICNTCGEPVGFASPSKREGFVACHGCNYPLCRQCLNEELKEGTLNCLRCGESYIREKVSTNSEVSGGRLRMAAHLQDHQDNGLHARNLSSFSAVDSELNDEYGNPIWKNRVDSWKEKKNKKNPKKKDGKESQIPLEQQMEGRENAEAGQPLSEVVPVSHNKLTPYRAVIIMRLLIPGFSSIIGSLILLKVLMACG